MQSSTTFSASDTATPDPWRINWVSDFETYAYQPVYLANGVYGGMLDLSGATMDLWSAQIGALPREGGGAPEVLYPVTALRTQMFFRNPEFAEHGIWLGRSGIHCADPRYNSDPSMPNRAQVYACRQSLDLQQGVATTSGSLFLGSGAARATGTHRGREVRFSTRVAALKESKLLGFWIEAEADTEILFVPELVLQERFGLNGSAKGVHALGNDIQCDLRLEQRLISKETSAGSIDYVIEPEGGAAYRVSISAPGTTVELDSLNGMPALRAEGRAFYLVEVLLAGAGASELSAAYAVDANAFFAEQTRRWGEFWQASAVTLPAAEAVWQQRYHASLFNVAQSLGDGPTHPGGLSRPMLPYWYGCFHDTDTYYCRALLESGHAVQAAKHLRYRYRGLDVARALARRLGRSGALYPWQTDMHGRGETHDVPTNGAIIAVEAWHHFAYARQAEAKAMAQEILRETLHNLADHLELDARPLRLQAKPLMTLSETMTAEDPTEVRVALHAVAVVWLQSGAGDPHLDALARRIIEELKLPEDAGGSYRLTAEGDSEPAFLRCPSVILGGFPLHILPADTRLGGTFEKELARILYLFAWLPHQASVVASQLQRREGPQAAAGLLRAADAFYKPWHAYDEWENRRAVRAANFVTAAGGFATALHHMLLAETAPGVWSLFAGAPDTWDDVAFQGLITRAGWRVSAQREGGILVNVEAEALSPESAPELTLEWPDHGIPRRRQWFLKKQASVRSSFQLPDIVSCPEKEDARDEE